MDLLLWTMEQAGPAFIKWAQWSSSRPDLFPQAICQRFEKLQTNAPSHDGQLSVEAVQAAFRRLEGGGAAGGRPVSVFESFDQEPVASGSIAQVSGPGRG
jgi:aarF domain-containing kinase